MSVLTKSNLRKLPLLLFFVFVVMFPKGGVKPGGIPLTWGYMLLPVFALAVLLGFIAKAEFIKLSLERFCVLFALLPFQIVVLFTLVAFGYTDAGLTLSLMTGFFAIPLVLIWILSKAVDRMDLHFAMRCLRFIVLVVSLFGIFLFIYKIVTGHFIDIPYLTVNGDEIDPLLGKDNNRGFASKLVSTYNNGNIYGVSILMLLPLYSYIEKRKFRRALVKFSIILTLSRTAWIGLILSELLDQFYINAPPFQALRRLKVPRKWALKSFRLLIVITAIGVGVVAALNSVGFGMDFLFDKSLGGRSDQLASLTHFTILPNQAFDAISEIVYASIISQFGILGLLAYLSAMATPVLMSLSGFIYGANSKYKKSITAGLIIYLGVSVSDGALLLIPVLLFFWSLVSLLVSSNLFTMTIPYIYLV